MTLKQIKASFIKDSKSQKPSKYLRRLTVIGYGNCYHKQRSVSHD